MNILVIGNGGREHALAWKLAQSAMAEIVYVAPGNAGTATEPQITNVAIDPLDIDGLLQFAIDRQIGLTVVGPEAPLVAGVVDRFSDAGLTIFGPTSAAAQLEGSKSFTKDFLARHQIPTAAYGNFTDVAAATEYIRQQGAPIVVKADGLAAGKGVILAQTEEEAIAAIEDMLHGNCFGSAGSRVVIEEFLTGEELSFICMVDGEDVLPMATSQDHKAAYDGDKGPNTGGMGAYSPAPVGTDAIIQRVMNEVILPTVKGMIAEGNRYRGFLYAGIMVAADGTPKVLEYNCRFGDPETQPIMMRLRSDLAQLCLAATTGTLAQQSIEWDPRPALGVVIAAAGYPGDYAKGEIISGPTQGDANSKIFHAGTSQKSGQTVTSGGRVLCATALGDTILQAQQNAYTLAKQVSWSGSWYRTDIGYRAVNRAEQ